MNRLAPKFPTAALQIPLIWSLCFAALLVSLWTATRPYIGIVHDARFYAFQVLNAISPGRFADDLYFKYGSQDQFTTFTAILKPFVATLGLSNGVMVATAVVSIGWLCGLSFFATGLFGNRRLAAAAMALAVALPSGPVFEYSEQFLTPRLLAEAIILWAFGAAIRRRFLVAAFLLSVAMLIHPLVTLPAVALFVLYEAGGRRWLWALAALGAATALILAILHVEPFARLLITMDDAWYRVVSVRDFFCFPTKWSIYFWIPVGIHILFLAAWLRSASQDARRFVACTLVVSAGGIAAAVVGGDILHNALLIQLQTWRATWLLSLFANISVVSLLRWDAAAPSLRFTVGNGICVISIMVLALAKLFPIVLISALVLSVVVVAYSAWERFARRPAPKAGILAALVIVALAADLAGFIIYFSMKSALGTPAWLDQHAWRFVELRGIAVTALSGFGLILLIASRQSGGWSRWWLTAPALATALFTVSVASWDQRTAWTKFVEAGAVPDRLQRSIGPSGSIYWEGDVRTPWFLLHRTSFLSCDQGTGVLFSRGTALEYQRRVNELQSVTAFPPDPSCPVGLGPRAVASARDLVTLCRQEPGLGSIVLTKPVSGLGGEGWTPPAALVSWNWDGGRIVGSKVDHLFIYNCGALRPSL